jgi:hypothetical protein
MSHIFSVRSALPEAMHWFSGWNATEVTTLQCECKGVHLVVLSNSTNLRSSWGRS